ncbi:L-dopachrome tautomerase yellow-f-like [Hyposmocoma kahamanoa]|uniref:L-dopachrome tautomerase yellow-f-like n=1 Tax=Hyposmocoma kahamanoa TaxID=1477025 RepID=UPI000E6D6280|nr:L-dopachrome tautomerase yellow-f-like [Hyposmocoma kahamanoa]
MFKCILVLFVINNYVFGSKHWGDKQKLTTVASWKQLSYSIDGVIYSKDTDDKNVPNKSNNGTVKSEKFFIQYNNVPSGVELDNNRVFVTVPRRQYGIPSTINFILPDQSSSVLYPFPSPRYIEQFVSVYRPRIDDCGRIWFVDTGLLEIPGERKQVKKPTIYAFDLKMDKLVVKYELKDTDLVNERTPGGLTSITIDVSPNCCNDAYAYINDLATSGMIVYSMKDNDSWRIEDPSFKYQSSAVNFTAAGYLITWQDGLFSIALSEPDDKGKRTAYYHSLVSTQEFAVDTKILKSGVRNLNGNSMLLGNRGPLTQSGSHDYHPETRILFFANVAQDAILCWRTDTALTEDNVGIAAQDRKKLVYISDLKVIKDEVWVLVNQMPVFIFSTLNPDEVNFYIHKANIRDLIRGTVCDIGHDK